MKRTSFICPTRKFWAVLFLASLGLGSVPVFAAVKASDTAWLSFLPKVERSKAIALLDETDKNRQSQVEDLDSTLVAEAAYAGTARILSRALDVYNDSPSAFSLALALSGQQSLSLEKAISALADNRRLRWETARDLVEKNMFRGKIETTIASREASLAALIKPRLAKVNRKILSAAASALAARIVSHFDCPQNSFTLLQAAADTLDDVSFRNWVLAVIHSDPAHLAATNPESILSGPDQLKSLEAGSSESVFVASLKNFSLAYSTRMLLRDAIPAAAAAAWYSDNSNQVPTLVPASSAALASLAAFLRSVASTESSLFSELARDDPLFAAASAESLSLAWLCHAQNPARFASDLSLDSSLIRTALSLAWKGLENEIEADELVLDIEAIRSADAFTLLVSNERNFNKILRALVSFRSQNSAFQAYKIGARYAESRKHLANLYKDQFKEVEADAEQHARASSTASLLEKTDNSLSEKSLQFRLLTSNLDPLSPIFVSAVLERTLEDAYVFQAAVPPAALVGAYKSFQVLIDAGLLSFPIPCCLVSRQPSSAEYALLDAGKAFYGSLTNGSEDELRLIIANKCAKTGVPASFVLAFAQAEDLPSRLSAFSSSSVRYLKRLNKVRDLDE